MVTPSIFNVCRAEVEVNEVVANAAVVRKHYLELLLIHIWHDQFLLKY